MRTDQAPADQQPDADPGSRGSWRGWWRQWRQWLPFVLKPLRRGIVIFVLLLVIEYLVVPELVGASKDLHLLGQVNPGWLVAGLVLEGASLFCYGLLTRALLPPGSVNPGLSRLFRIDLAAAAVAHVIPAGTLGSAGIGYRLFTAEGIKGNDAGVMMATKGLGSTVMLNVLLWLSLVISIPLAGFHPIYVTVAILGAVVLLAVALLFFGITRGTQRASRILHMLGDRIPGLTGEGLERAFREVAASLSALARDRHVLVWSLTWAALNWLLDAASLWCFVAAFGRFVNPVELFAAYGIANVAGVLPVSPGGRDGQDTRYVGDPVGGEQLHRIDETAKGGHEAPQRRGIQQPVERGPGQRPEHGAPVAGKRGQRRPGLAQALLKPFTGQPGNPVADGVQDAGSAADPAGDAEGQSRDRKQQHGADDGDGHVDRVKARQRDGDDEGQPQQHVQHHGGAQALGRHHDRGVVALDTFRGEQAVADPRAA